MIAALAHWIYVESLKVWKAWRHYVKTRRDKDASNTAAVGFLRSIRLRRVLLSWREFMSEARKAFEALAFFELKVTKMCFGFWIGQLEEARKINFARAHFTDRLTRSSIEIWKELVRKEGIIRGAHRRAEERWIVRCWEGLKVYLRERREKAKAKEAALFYYEGRLVRYSWDDWRSYVMMRRVKWQAKQLAIEHHEGRSVARFFAVWLRYVLERRDKRAREEYADDYFKVKLAIWGLDKLKALVSEERKEYKASLEYAATYDAIGTVRRSFYAWIVYKSESRRDR